MMVHDLDALRRKIEIISGGNYSLSLTTVDPTQVLYNGKFSYLMSYDSPRSGRWCHLLLLRSKNKHSKQLLAIITQTPDRGDSIVNNMEHIATFVMNFFFNIYPPVLREGEDPDDPPIMTPENTIFVEYLPAGCWPGGGHDEDTFAVMNFDWKEVPFGQSSSYYQAGSSGRAFGTDMWKHATLSTINDLIARL